MWRGKKALESFFFLSSLVFFFHGKETGFSRSKFMATAMEVCFEVGWAGCVGRGMQFAPAERRTCPLRKAAHFSQVFEVVEVSFKETPYLVHKWTVCVD